MDFDSTDWPSDIQDQATLLRLDEAASCAICHGPYSIPLALPCGHSCELIPFHVVVCDCKLPLSGFHRELQSACSFL